MDRPKVIAFFLDAEVADDDPHRAIKQRARDIGAAAAELEAAARHGHAAARADLVSQAADLFADAAFDPGQTWDAGLAAGLTDADLDASAYVALTLEQIERDGP